MYGRPPRLKRTAPLFPSPTLFRSTRAAIRVGRGIARPVAAMTAAMRGLAAGDKGTEIPARGRRDEVGEMAAAVQVFKDNMIRADELAAEQEAERVAREIGRAHV